MRTTLKIPEELDAELEERKKEYGCSKADLIRFCTVQYLKQL